MVIEAKYDEMERGFRQLAVELIATADQLDLSHLYGAGTTGGFWRFGLLNREASYIIRDLVHFPCQQACLRSWRFWLDGYQGRREIRLTKLDMVSHKIFPIIEMPR